MDKERLFFRLKNVELSYTLNNNSKKGIGKNYKFFVRGANLFVLSGIKELDPEQMLAGISNYPVSARLQVEYLLTSKVDAIMKVLKYIFSMMLLGGIISAVPTLTLSLQTNGRKVIHGEMRIWRKVFCYLFIRMS